ncbi:Rpn family recombination-promoting nuclease/putative transposase [Oscillospiraceae bacterium Marseille-Q3528]|nr:Rpn family recombination-promoting nuclease/putative transposase [Oscillospiraceae bacterium Marseille-Q3528]
MGGYGMEENFELLEGYQFNLSDFALFLSVMKDPRAYRCVLSVFMDEPDIELQDVKVEQVVLDKSGKRAIRLDAWAKSVDNRQFNMEMQNDARQDDLRKRSRFYQGMLDTPILKSGKETRYRMLPSTVIIFITQEDIFGRDRAKYTFTEQCEEVPDLKLDDGTTKIFFNMESKNGAPELISMLSYMKDTRLNNPDILVKDKRIVELNDIVEEVKDSEEWEAVKMNILEIGIEKGMQQGAEKKMLELVEKKLKKGQTISQIADALEESEEKIQEIADSIQKDKSPL